MKRFINAFLTLFIALLLAYIVLCVFFPATASAYTSEIDAVYTSLAHAQTAQTLTHPGRVAHPSGPYSVLGSPTVSAAFIDRVLCKAGSPACGKGQVIYELGIRYGIDPAYALAFFKHESTYGTQGEARTTLSLGNLRCINDRPCIDQERGGYAQMGSWEDGFNHWYALIRDYYIGERGADTVDKIIPIYAPNSDGNSEQDYIRDIEQTVSAWREQNGVAR